jgi:hypothetical protein
MEKEAIAERGRWDHGTRYEEGAAMIVGRNDHDRTKEQLTTEPPTMSERSSHTMRKERPLK